MFGIVKDVMLFLVYLITMLIFSSLSSFAQGAWDIKYLPVDALNSSFINKDIRIDFKAFATDTLLIKKVNAFDVRYLLNMKDTVKIKVKNEHITFIQHWLLYLDEGILRNQTLISIFSIP